MATHRKDFVQKVPTIPEEGTYNVAEFSWIGTAKKVLRINSDYGGGRSAFIYLSPSQIEYLKEFITGD